VTSSCRTSNLWTVSSRYDRDDLPVLPEEDDWFATPFQEPMETDEVAWHGHDQSVALTIPPLGVVWLAPA